MVNIKKQVDEKLYALNGLTPQYCTNETIDGLYSRRKFSFDELKKIDLHALILTFEKCAMDMQQMSMDYSDKDLIYMQIINDLKNNHNPVVIKETYEKLMNIFQDT